MMSRGASRSHLVKNSRNENTSRSDPSRWEIRDEKSRRDLVRDYPREVREVTLIWRQNKCSLVFSMISSTPLHNTLSTQAEICRWICWYFGGHRSFFTTHKFDGFRCPHKLDVSALFRNSRNGGLWELRTMYLYFLILISSASIVDRRPLALATSTNNDRTTNVVISNKRIGSNKSAWRESECCGAPDLHWPTIVEWWSKYAIVC